MSRPAIVVENLSKKFRIGTGGGPGYHRLSEMLTGLPRFAYNKLRPTRTILDADSPRPASGRAVGGEGLSVSSVTLPPGESNRSEERASDFWALKDVSFEVQPGEVVGIIGRNGAGKSTLLKILSRITEPTSGRFGVRGRVASLLEVGTGFHPELTGRENIYVSGITLGMTRAEIKKRFDEIVDFSGVEKFLDTPVKHYSSGMQVRLGFAVAAHLESEILIIDEVLAVGDAEFQKKCLGRVQKAAKSGRTVLLVSHSISSLSALCTSALLLNSGKVEANGQAEQVLLAYRKSLGSLKTKWVCDLPSASSRILRQASIETRYLEESNFLFVRIEFYLQHLTNVNVGISFEDQATGVRVFGTATDIDVGSVKLNSGRHAAIVKIDVSSLYPRTFNLTVAVSDNAGTDIERDALLVELDRLGSAIMPREQGIVNLKRDWQFLEESI